MWYNMGDGTPRLEYEESTGYIVLSDGRVRQVVCRPEGFHLYLWWKGGGGKEHPVTIDELVALAREAQDKARA
jgi:hypothetical protein